MITRRIAIFAALSVAFYPVLPALPASDPDLLAGLDTDHDGTVSLDEPKKAAEVMFDKLDRGHDGTLKARELRGRLSAREFTAADTDKDGTLDVKELKGRLTQQEFTAADPDNDGTLSKDEYLAVVEKRFKAADPDNDGTVSAAELKTATGRSLTQLMS